MKLLDLFLSAILKDWIPWICQDKGGGELWWGGGCYRVAQNKHVVVFIKKLTAGAVSCKEQDGAALNVPPC